MQCRRRDEWECKVRTRRHKIWQADIGAAQLYIKEIKDVKCAGLFSELHPELQ